MEIKKSFVGSSPTCRTSLNKTLNYTTNMTPQYIEIDENNNKSYYKDKAMEILHREDGPALEFGSGTKYWYLDGYNLSEEEFLKKTSKEIVLTMDEIAAKLGIDVSKLKIKK